MQMELLVVKPSANFSCKKSPKWRSRELLIQFCMKVPSRQAPWIGLPRQYSCRTRAVQTCSMESRKSRAISSSTEGLWQTAGATLSGILFEGSVLTDAYAAESVDAASRAPQWLAPAVLAFPVFSYALFNIYRDKVNPGAKVSDWMFGLAAMVIVANLITISTLGVTLRLPFYFSYILWVFIWKNLDKLL